MNDLTFERELRSTLHGLVPADVPASLSDAVAALPQRWRTRPAGPLMTLLRWAAGGRRLAAATMSLAAVAMVAVLGAVVVLGYGLRPPGSGAGSGPRAYDWNTQVASLQADAVSIDVGGRTFRAPANAQVHSDPGDSTYQTLELDWSEQGVEQRLFVYFAADPTDWWVSEIRSYNGAQPGDWIYYDAPQVATPRGMSYVGNLDLSGTGSGMAGELRIDNMRLTAFVPGTGVVYQTGCQFVGAAATASDQPAAPRPMNPDLSRYGIAAGMAASLADSRLTAAGVCHDFRYEYTASSYAQEWCVAPPGIVGSWAYGSAGQVILFVEASPGETLPPDAPLLVGC